MLRSDLCDYGDTYIFVKGTIDPGVARNNGMTQKGVAFKNNALFKPYISKFNCYAKVTLSGV